MKMYKGKRLSTISPEELAALQGEFVGLDKDGDGKISVEELETLLKSLRLKLRISETDIRRALKKIDKNGDGIVDTEELVRIIKKYDIEGVIYKALSHRSQMRKEFQKYDADNSGFITKDELVHVFNERTGVVVSEAQLDGMMNDHDVDDDGQINYEEFCVMMTTSVMQKKVVAKKSNKSIRFRKSYRDMPDND